MSTRQLFALILITQTGCAAFGLAFHHLYMRSALVQAEEDAAFVRLAADFQAVAPRLDQKSPLPLTSNEPAWQALVAQWRKVAGQQDRLYLLDNQGRIVASADDRESAAVADGVMLSIKQRNASAEWGKTIEPVRGVLDDDEGSHRVALAHALGAQGGYLAMTRVARDEQLPAEAVESALWVAGAVSLLWTVVPLAAILFIIMTRFQLDRAGEQAGPDVEAIKQAQALVRTQETVIFGLAQLADSRDPETGGHLERIAHYSTTLATALRLRPEFRDQISSTFLHQIGISSALHDIGKVGVEDSVLRKPGLLTSEERTRIQTHTGIGDNCLKEIERRLGSSNFLQMAREIASAHHERWDGMGYPVGLAGEQIPLAARIVAVADVYDALSRKRVYKPALPHDECVAIIAENAGTQFDPRIVEVFLQVADRFLQISEQFDGNAPAPSTMLPAATGQSAGKDDTEERLTKDINAIAELVALER